MYVQIACAQDTVRVSLQDFVTRGLKNSDEIDAARQDVNLATNTVRQTQGKRYLPKFDLNTQHGLVPGVKSDRSDLSPHEYYLDPELDNDWGNIGVFTRANVEAIQPIFTWGALKNAIKASKAGVNAAQNQFQIKKDETKLRLYKLYQNYLLSLEVQRLLDDAQGQIKKIADQLYGKNVKQDSTIDESDIFRFKVFRSEFGVRASKVKENARYVQRVWNYVMQADDNTVYVPKKRFLDPVQNKLKGIDYYMSRALSDRPEIKALTAGINAAEFGVRATKAQNYPSIFLGLSGSYANTPNRPRQSNPFIINNTNYASARVGFGIRQNLDFFSMHYDVKESRLNKRKAQFSKNAAIEGIHLQIDKQYKDARIAKTKIQRTDDALITAKKWVRQEKLDYDFEMGDPKDLISAIQKELELRISYKQAILEFNQDMADLFKSSAMPVTSLKSNFSE